MSKKYKFGDTLDVNLDTSRIDNVEQRLWSVSKEVDRVGRKVEVYEKRLADSRVNAALNIFLVLAAIFCFLLGVAAMRFDLLNFVF